VREVEELLVGELQKVGLVKKQNKAGKKQFKGKPYKEYKEHFCRF